MPDLYPNPTPTAPCPACGMAVPPGQPGLLADRTCPSCGEQLQMVVFPAFFQGRGKGRQAPPVIQEKETSCFYHNGKRAAVPCSVCGRFLCTLCDIQINGQHLCPACMETGRQTQKIRNLESSRIRYDKIALYLAIVPMTGFFWFLVVITAPAAIFVVIRYWKAPNSILSGSLLRYICALLLAGIQVAGISFLINKVIHL